MVFFLHYLFVFFFKLQTAYEMRISDCSSDVCSSYFSPFSRASRRRLGVARSVFCGSDMAQACAAKIPLAVSEAEDFRTRSDRFVGSSTLLFRPVGRPRSEERRVGEDSVRTCRYRGVGGKSKKQKRRTNR